jgi:hypothetical protein
VERKEEGVVHLKCNGKYWTCIGNEEIGLSEGPSDFYFELVEGNKMKIRAGGGYLVGGSNGGICIGDVGTLWEF